MQRQTAHLQSCRQRKGRRSLVVMLPPVALVAAAKPMHIVQVVADDLGYMYNDLGIANGNKSMSAARE